MALKNDVLYILEDNIKDKLPIAVGDNLPELVTIQGDVVKVVRNKEGQYSTFRITPAKVMTYRQLLECFDQKHQNQEDYTYLYSNILHAALLGRINVCVATHVSFGKSFFGDCMNYIYDLMPNVDAPKTAPAIAPGISTYGVLRIDELSGLSKKEDRVAVENVIGGLADFSDTVSFGTAGSKLYKTMNPPPTYWLSCVITYNKFGTKEDVESKKASYFRKEDYFDWMFPNSTKLVDRFVRFLFPDGKVMVNQFNSDVTYTPELRAKFIAMAKTAEYYRQARINGFTNPLVVDGVTYEPEMTEEEVGLIDKMVYTNVGKESRHSRSLRDLFLFTFLMADKDWVLFANYCEKYVDYMKAYNNMINTEEKEGWF
jgi:hypothetical protein